MIVRNKSLLMVSNNMMGDSVNHITIGKTVLVVVSVSKEVVEGKFKHLI